MRLVPIVCAGVVLSFGAPVEARATSVGPSALLRRGIALYREASYAASVAALEQARAGAGALEAVEQVECAFYLAADYVALGSLKPAEAELRRVIALEPGYEAPPFTSPKVAGMLAEVRAAEEHSPRLHALRPRVMLVPGGRTVEVAFEASRTGGTAYGAVSYRLPGERTVREAPLAHVGDRLAAQLSLGEDGGRGRAGTVEYWAEAQSPAGVMRAGSSARPFELAVQALALSPPRSKRGRVAGIVAAVGVVTIAAGLGLGLGLYYGLRAGPGPTADVVLDVRVR